MTAEKSNKDLISLHKRIYSQMKRKALSFAEHLPEELKKYQLDQKSYNKRSFELTNGDTLIEQVRQSEIIYVGDFHTFDQSSKNLQRILRVLANEEKKLTIGIEFIHTEYQAEIDNYLAGNITELEFLEHSNYSESWRFPWNHYKTFFDFAAKGGHKILALNSSGSLLERDEAAAKLIAKYYNENPNSYLLVLFGELHIVPDKLPARVKAYTKKLPSYTIIHQNLDEVYWKIQEESGTNHVVKFNDNEYSLQTSPPWIKYESMIYWYENLCDDPEFDIHEYIIETGVKTFSDSVNENFVFLAKEIATALGLEMPQDDLEDFNLHDHRDLYKILSKLKTLKKNTLENFLIKQVLSGRSFKIPYTNDFYCSSYSINRLSYLAGIHIQNLILIKHKSEAEKSLSKNEQTAKLLFFAHQTMFAYIASKIINPFRKCDLYLDIKDHIQSQDKPKADLKALELCIQILDGPKNLVELCKGHDLYSLNRAGKHIGHILGNSIYDLFFHGKSESFSKIILESQNHITDHHYFSELVHTVLEEDYKNQRKRLF